MYGLNRLKSANQLVALFTAAAARSIAVRHSSLRSPAGIDDFVKGGEGSKIRNSRSTYERKMLPPELSRRVPKLMCESAADGGVCDVYLVGTNHFNPESRQDVQAVIQSLKPQVVFVSLCSTRAGVLTNEGVKDDSPDGDLCVAYKEAMKCGAKVILGDRPIEITLQRIPVVPPLQEMRNLDFAILEDFLKKLEKGLADDDTLNLAFHEMAKMGPTFSETFIHERDRYMSAKLLEVAREHNSVVAVVGMPHLPGIQKNWKQPVDMKQLLHITVGNRIITHIGGVGSVVALYAGVYLHINK